MFFDDSAIRYFVVGDESFSVSSESFAELSPAYTFFFSTYEFQNIYMPNYISSSDVEQLAKFVNKNEQVDIYEENALSVYCFGQIWNIQKLINDSTDFILRTFKPLQLLNAITLCCCRSIDPRIFEKKLVDSCKELLFNPDFQNLPIISIVNIISNGYRSLSSSDLLSFLAELYKKHGDKVFTLFPLVNLSNCSVSALVSFRDCLNPKSIYYQFLNSLVSSSLMHSTYEMNVRKHLNSLYDSLKKAADGINGSCELAVSHELLSGIIADPSVRQSLFYLQKAAEKNNPDAVLEYAQTLDKKDENIKDILRAYEKSLKIQPQKTIEHLCKRGDELRETDNEKSQALLYLGVKIKDPLCFYEYSKSLFTAGNEKSGNYYLRLAAKAEYPKAELELGKQIYLTKKDEGIILIKAAADHGLPEALYYYAQYTSDMKEKIKYLTQSAENSYPEALYELADMYEKGIQIRRDLNKALRYFKMSADQNDPLGQHKYAQLLKQTNGNIQEIKDNLFLSSEKGNPEAQVELGIIYLKENDDKKAYEYFKKSSEQKNGKGMYYLSKIARKGTVESKDEAKADQLLYKSADLGYSGAQYKIGKFLLEKKGKDEKDGENKGLVYLKKAVDQENSKAEYLFAQYSLKKKKFEDFKIFITKSADHGNTKAMNHLGKCLFYGDIFDMNKKEGERYLKMSADVFDHEGEYEYANALRENNSDTINEGILYYLKRSADSGYSKAQNAYGVVLLNEIHNPSEAAKYFYLCAEQFDPDGIFNYANMLKNGDGIEKDEEKAKYYFNLYESIISSK